MKYPIRAALSTAVVATSLLIQNVHAEEPAKAGPSPVAAEQHSMGMNMDMDGAVMNENHDKLPQDCTSLGGDYKFTVHVGSKYAQKFPGTMFAYDTQEWNVEPCSKVTFTLINDDSIRHQFMLHGLPMYLYHQGMFHMEVTGPNKQKTGTFIVPSIKRTYFVHCDMAQHTEKGLRGQLKVGGGSGNLDSVPGISAAVFPDAYETRWDLTSIAAVLVAAAAGTVGGLRLFQFLSKRDLSA
jgi:hypothetical protein